ncbi:uncharacterized protein [Primulina huaijiensis]|uniref:uncharacterized protein n=1 Tax=Primulina huaijiensis TaxID=1492673 RepID=UPI003CC6E979
MESTSTRGIDHHAHLPICSSNNIIDLKLEISHQDFCMENLQSSKSYLQDFNHLDHFSVASSPFDPDIGIRMDDDFNSFEPFFHDSSSDFELYKNDQENTRVNTDEVGMQNFKDGELFLNFLNKPMEVKTSIIYQDRQPLSFVFHDDHDRNSRVSDGDVTVSDKKDAVKRSKNVRTKNSDHINIEGEPATAKKSGKGRKKTKSAKGQWTIEEDELLIQLVEKYGVRKWSQIAQVLKGRIGKQCRERWHNHLRPDIKKDLWTEEEDRILIEAHAEVGNKWAEITKKLPGRTENSIKNHWNATKRRQFSRRKCRTKWPKPSSLLQNYIKSLNFDKEGSSKSKNAAPAQTDQKEGLNVSSPQKLETELCPVDQMVPEYDFDEIPEFSFDDDHDLFDDRGMESFIGDIPRDQFSEIDDVMCFDVELPFDLHSEVKKEVDFFDDEDIELMDLIS